MPHDFALENYQQVIDEIHGIIREHEERALRGPGIITNDILNKKIIPMNNPIIKQLEQQDKNGQTLFEYKGLQGYLVPHLHFNCQVKSNRFSRWRRHKENKMLKTQWGDFVTIQQWQNFKEVEPVIRML